VVGAGSRPSSRSGSAGPGTQVCALATASMPRNVLHSKHATDAARPRHKTKEFLEKKERLKELLIPFPEKALAKHAPEALALLLQDPDLLDTDTIQALVAEHPKKELQEGQVG
jgi:hypothetical protein